ncbi:MULTISPECIES: hypothetical protein [unclassified Sphingomonas]|uniref:hypothetical protein n=1 Tax=unclassified Sphingomonas TaxID=196159 RepID=UPI00226A87E7|nr:MULTISPECIES: hypothetical protein [unclassified Sphingomonas]
MTQLQVCAAAAGLTPTSYAKQLLEGLLSSKPAATAAQADAERYLMQWVHRIASEYRVTGQWQPDITLTIFERIRLEIPERHAAAVIHGRRTTVHRAIGSEIRRALGAVTHVVDGKLDTGHVPRGQGYLIASYTCLYPPEK